MIQIKWVQMLFLMVLGMVALVPSISYAQESVSVETSSVSVETSSVSTYTAYQEFEHGIMIWREDTGDVMAFFNMGQTMQAFPEANYSLFPDTVMIATPTGFVQTVNSFNRVWQNYYSAQQLGWAVASEVGYTAEFVTLAPTNEGLSRIKMTLPDGEYLVLLGNGRWQYPQIEEPPTIAPLPPTDFISSVPYNLYSSASWQTFEHGYMMYWAQTGTILVFYDSGEWQLIPSATYAHLPENPIQEAPPVGYSKPIFGFGKVWGHFPEIRQRLGWGVYAEQGYLMRFERGQFLATIDGHAFYYEVSLPDGRSLRMLDGNSWYFLD